ncbi:MAG: T9SS type A sorting domain-containing protein [Salibacteraceae bacterium]
MVQRILLFIGCFLGFSHVQSQHLFQHIEGFDALPISISIEDVDIALDDHIFVAAEIVDSLQPFRRVGLRKLDPDGDELWSYSFGRQIRNARGVAVRALPDGGAITLAETWVAPAAKESRVWLIRTDAAGQILWRKEYGDASASYEPFDMTIDPNGGFAVVGRRINPPGLDYDIFILKLDDQGNAVWVLNLGGNSVDTPRRIRAVGNLGFVVVGTTLSFNNGDIDAFVAVINSVGDLFGFHTYGTFTDENAYDVVVTPDQKIIVSGVRFTPFTQDDAMVFQTDINGQVDWAYTYDGGDFDSSVEMMETSQGYRIGGYFTDTNTFQQFGLSLHIDTVGQLLQARSFRSANTIANRRFEHLNQFANGDWLFGGDTPWAFNSAFRGKTMLVRTDTLGNTYCQDNAVAMQVDPLVLTSNSFLPFTTHPIFSFTDTVEVMAQPYNFDSNACDSCYYAPPLPEEIPMQLNSLTAQFTNPIYWADSVSWNFGDGTPAVTQVDPTHTYTNFGKYEVCVQAFGRCGNVTVCDSVDLNNVGILTHSKQAIRIYPNPVAGMLTVDLGILTQENYAFTIVDMHGRTIRNWLLNGQSQHQLSREGIASGVYYFQVSGPDGISSGKLIFD